MKIVYNLPTTCKLKRIKPYCFASLLFKTIQKMIHAKKLFPEVENFELLNHQVASKKDLLTLSNLILTEIKDLISEKKPQTEWLRSTEVRKLLKISPGTLQNLRINGTLKYNRVGGTIFYKYEDIEKMLNQ
jgi:hypothetical protein